MLLFKVRWAVIFASIVAVAFAALPAADAQEFRVDTELFENQEKEPFLVQLTIFAADGVVYDFRLTEPLETMIYDSRNGRFTLIDESRKAKATVSTQDLLSVSMNLETEAAQRRNALVAFCAAPQFETTEKPLEKNGQSLVELKLVGKPLSYAVEAIKPQRPLTAKTYRQFADWCVRLNSMRPDNLLPCGARLALNQALAERELLPLEVTRTIPPQTRLGKKHEVHMQHRFNWALCGEDHKKIQRAGDMMAKFQAISYDEYRGVIVKDNVAKQARR